MYEPRLATLLRFSERRRFTAGAPCGGISFSSYDCPHLSLSRIRETVTDWYRPSPLSIPRICPVLGCDMGRGSGLFQFRERGVLPRSVLRATPSGHSTSSVSLP